MANSDNVVRAGLTPKHKDVDTLIGMLDYRGRSIEEILFRPSAVCDIPAMSLYAPPVPDFALERILVSFVHHLIMYI